MPFVSSEKTVPPDQYPPIWAVPKSVLLDNSKPALKPAPSLLVKGEPYLAVKLYRFVKPAPFASIAKTTPFPDVPPKRVVPYRTCPEASSPPKGPAPSLLEKVLEVAVKLCNVINDCPIRGGEVIATKNPTSKTRQDSG